MHSELLLVVLILIIGCASFLFGVIYLVCSALRIVGRGVYRLVVPSGGRGCAARRSSGAPLVCSRPGCRKIEYRKARFCSRCGAALTAAAVSSDARRPVREAG